MKCTEFRALERGSLRGFATLELDNGLVINDCTWHVTESGEWVSPPGKPRINAARELVRGADGKIEYTPVVAFNPPTARQKWSAAACRAIREHLESTKPAAGGLREGDSASLTTTSW